MATMRKIRTGLAMVVTVTAMALVTSVPAAQAGSSCGIRWGSLDKVVAGGPGGALVNVRAGRHDCYDRLVMDVRGTGAGPVQVRYVQAVYTQGRGDVLALRGRAFLDVVLQIPTYDINTGAATYTPANANELVNVNGWRTFRQVAEGGSFEGYTTIGLGVRARLPFRVFSLTGPGDHSRLVIDVAHHW